MRILWIGKGNSGGGGDEVYDRKLVASLRREGVEICQFVPTRVSRGREFANLVLGVPHYRTWFAGSGNERRLREAIREADVVIASWEPFDRLAFAVCDRPVIAILHNVTSLSLPSLFPGQPIPRFLARTADRWERKAYGSGRFAAIAVLSRADEAHVQALPGAPLTIYAPPGMPHCVPLAPGAVFRAELVVSGTYDWRPKRRDVIAFAHEFAALGTLWPVYADPLPEEAAATLTPQRIDAFDPAAAVRLGLIPDRFEAGHKLKTTFYLARNAIVLSYADVSADFRDIDDHGFFIRRLGHASEIARHAAEVASVPPLELAQRLERFKRLCAHRFSWNTTGETLLHAARVALADAAQSHS